MTLSKSTLSAAFILSFATAAFAEDQPLLKRRTDDGFFSIPGNIEVVCSIFKDKVVITQGQKGSGEVEVSEKPFNAKGLEALIDEAQKAEISYYFARTDGPTRLYVAYGPDAQVVDLGTYEGEGFASKNESSAALELRAVLDKNCPAIFEYDPALPTEAPTGETIPPPSK